MVLQLSSRCLVPSSCCSLDAAPWGAIAVASYAHLPAHASRCGLVSVLDTQLNTISYSLPLNGVFHTRWLAGGALLAAACTDGKLVLLRHCTDSKWLWTQESVQVSASEYVTAVAPAERSIVASLSNGTVARMHESAVEVCWQAHDAETWTVDSLHEDINSLALSGGDDHCAFVWDSRCRQAAQGPLHHGAGVTCTRFVQSAPTYICTSSYDGIVRLWDMRKEGSPAWQSARFSSGIWQLSIARFSSVSSFAIMSACTFSGVAMLFPAAEDAVPSRSASQLIYGACSHPQKPNVGFSADFYQSAVQSWQHVVQM